jgi:glucosamine-6-phosphate deaminase
LYTWVYDSVDQVNEVASMLLLSQLVERPKSVLGLATGNSPLGVYQRLIENYRRGLVDMSRASSFNLDEYCGLAPEHPGSYHYYMQKHLFEQVNFRSENIHIPSGVGECEANARDYELELKRSGGVDLQLLGLGQNGHIGFNEPGGAFIFHTHKVALTESTIEANRPLFENPGDIPRHAITMGVGNILEARKILLIATGEAKAQAVSAMIHGDITPRLPASILHTHANVTVLLDRAAASAL